MSLIYTVHLVIGMRNRLSLGMSVYKKLCIRLQCPADSENDFLAWIQVRESFDITNAFSSAEIDKCRADMNAD